MHESRTIKTVCDKNVIEPFPKDQKGLEQTGIDKKPVFSVLQADKGDQP